MSSHIAAMRRSFRCAGRTVASFVALCLVLLPRGQAFAQNAQQAAPSQPVELPVISVTVPPPSKPTISAAGNSVVVSPTTIPTPSYEFGKLDDRHHRSRHREPSVSHRSRCAVACSRSQHRANRRTRRSDVGVHPRDQLQPRQGPDRRHRRLRSQQSKPIFRFRPVADRGHCPHRSAARAAKRPLRLGRDRRRHCDHDQKGPDRRR